MARPLRSGERSDERSRRCMESYHRRPGETVQDQRPQQRQGAAVRPGDGVRHPRGTAPARGEDGRHGAPGARGVHHAQRTAMEGQVDAHQDGAGEGSLPRGLFPATGGGRAAHRAVRRADDGEMTEPHHGAGSGPYGGEPRQSRAGARARGTQERP
eukprot:ctg_2869.g536